MASLAEQIVLLSNPEPKRFDLDDDEFDVTRAQVIDKPNKYENTESQIVQNTTTLLKKTVPSLQDKDTKYAGRKISRAQLEDVDSSEDDVISKSIGNESDDDGIKDENICQKLTFDSSEDNSDIEKELGKSRESGVDEEADENEVLESEDIQKGIISFSEDKDSDDDSGNEKNEFDKIEDVDEEEEEERDSHGDIQKFSSTGLKDNLEKGKAAKNQIGLWDSFLEIRIRLQKALLLANKLPQKDKLAPFKSSGDKNLIETYKQGREKMVDLLGNLLLIQEKLLEQNPDTTNVLYPGTSSTNCASHGSNDSDGDDEEISSDSEEEKRSNDGDLDREELANGREEEESLKLPNKRKKHTMAASEFEEYICKRHAAFKSYRDATISKWSEKTRLASGKLNSKSFSSFERSALAQINHILSDKGRLLKRTQLKRSSYRVFGKTDDETQESGPKQEQTDMHLKDYDAEIFDDDDFYHQLLREFIEQRTGGGTDNPIEMGRQWLELQKLRRKVKKHVDRKASKGRKIRYDVHPKLVSFMAPIEKGPMVDSSRNELFCSLFGARQPEQECDISVFR